MAAYEEAIAATSTPHAPWYVVPADHKWVSRAAVAAILCSTIRSLGLSWPAVDAAKQQAIHDAHLRLEAE